MYTCKPTPIPGAPHEWSYEYIFIRPDGRLIPLLPPAKQHKGARSQVRASGHVRPERVHKHYRKREETQWGWNPTLRLWREQTGDPFMRYEDCHSVRPGPATSSASSTSTLEVSTSTPQPQPALPSRQVQRKIVKGRQERGRPADRVEDVASGLIIGRNSDTRALLLKVGNWSSPGGSPLREGMDSLCVEVESDDDVMARVACLSLDGDEAVAQPRSSEIDDAAQVASRSTGLATELGLLRGDAPAHTPTTPPRGTSNLSATLPATPTPPSKTRLKKKKSRSPSKHANTSAPTDHSDLPPPSPSRALRRSSHLAASASQPGTEWPRPPLSLVALDALSPLAYPLITGSPPHLRAASLRQLTTAKCAGTKASWTKCLAHSASSRSPRRALAELLVLRYPFGFGVREVQQSLSSPFPVASSATEEVRQSTYGSKPSLDLRLFGGRVQQDPLPGLLTWSIARATPLVGDSPCSAGPGPTHGASSTRLQRRSDVKSEAAEAWAASPFVGMKRSRADNDDGNASPPKSPRSVANSGPPEAVIESHRRLVSVFEEEETGFEIESDTPALSRSSTPSTPLLLTPSLKIASLSTLATDGIPTSSAADEAPRCDRVRTTSFEGSPKDAQVLLEPWRPSSS